MRSLAAIAALMCLAGCESISYYGQAIGGHFKLLSAARPIDTWLADPATPADLRQHLETARGIRQFATRELHLPDNASYTTYADLGRRSGTLRGFYFGSVAASGFFPFRLAFDGTAAKVGAGSASAL